MVLVLVYDYDGRPSILTTWSGAEHGWTSSIYTS